MTYSGPRAPCERSPQPRRASPRFPPASAGRLLPASTSWPGSRGPPASCRRGRGASSHRRRRRNRRAALSLPGLSRGRSTCVGHRLLGRATDVDSAAHPHDQQTAPRPSECAAPSGSDDRILNMADVVSCSFSALATRPHLKNSSAALWRLRGIFLSLTSMPSSPTTLTFAKRVSTFRCTSRTSVAPSRDAVCAAICSGCAAYRSVQSQCAACW